MALYAALKPLFHCVSGFAVCLKAYPDTNLQSQRQRAKCPLHRSKVKSILQRRPAPVLDRIP
jgi:hypothetical protein